jgi:LAO/AO transport system kinase
MEIADIFVVNKSDRPDADAFLRNLRMMLAPAFQKTHREIPIIKTVAVQKAGLKQLFEAMENALEHLHTSERRYWLLTEKVYHIVQKQRMKDLNKGVILENIISEAQKPHFNLYKFAASLV